MRSRIFRPRWSYGPVGTGVPAGPEVMTARDGGRHHEKEPPAGADEYGAVFTIWSTKSRAGVL
jgi:hypothetical protein